MVYKPTPTKQRARLFRRLAVQADAALDAERLGNWSLLRGLLFERADTLASLQSMLEAEDGEVSDRERQAAAVERDLTRTLTSALARHRDSLQPGDLPIHLLPEAAAAREVRATVAP